MKKIYFLLCPLVLIILAIGWPDNSQKINPDFEQFLSGVDKLKYPFIIERSDPDCFSSLGMEELEESKDFKKIPTDQVYGFLKDFNPDENSSYFSFRKKVNQKFVILLFKRISDHENEEEPASKVFAATFDLNGIPMDTLFLFGYEHAGDYKYCRWYGEDLLEVTTYTPPTEMRFTFYPEFMPEGCFPEPEWKTVSTYRISSNGRFLLQESRRNMVYISWEDGFKEYGSGI